MIALAGTIRYYNRCHMLSCVHPESFTRPQLVDHLAEDMAKEGIEGRTITLKLKLSNFEVGAQLYYWYH